MLPALSLKPSFGRPEFEEGNPHSCVQLFWNTDRFWAVTYLHQNGEVSGSHLWIGQPNEFDCPDFSIEILSRRWAA